MNTRRFLNLIVIALLINMIVLSWAGSAGTQANASRCYVNDDASGANTGTDWQNAYTDLQSALENHNCAEVWVAKGLYKPGASGDLYATFRLRTKLEMFGGFAGTETSLNQRDWEANVTILSGDIDNNDITDPDGVVTDPTNIVGANSYHVLRFYDIMTDWTTVIDGFTVTAGSANGNGLECVGGGLLNDGNIMLAHATFSANRSSFEGGAIYNQGDLFISYSSFNQNRTYIGGGGIFNFGNLVVSDSKFAYNYSSESGGGIDSSGQLTVTHSVFSENLSGTGGAIMNRVYSYILPYAMLTVNTSYFIENTAYNAGGGIFNSDDTATVTNSTFSLNSTNGSGGGISNDSGTLTASNSTFSANKAQGVNSESGFGGGIFNNIGTINLNSNTFLVNSASQNGGAIYNKEGTANLANTIVANSSMGSNCSGAITDGGGNLSYPDVTCPGENEDPLLGPLQDNGGPTLTHALSPGSPAIDNAISASSHSTDQRGLPRQFDGNQNGIPGDDTGSFEWISAEFIHYPPSISGFPDLTIKDNIANYALAFRIGDEDTPISSLTLSADSSDLNLFPIANILLEGTQDDRIIYLTPMESMTGSATITVTVTDGQLEASDSFLVMVNPNNAPVLDAIEDRSGFIGETVTFTATASDIDGDMLTFSLGPDAPAGASIDPIMGLFNWTPTSARTFGITIFVSDGESEAYQTFAITIHAKSYIPVIVKPTPGISGKVTMNGIPAQWVTLYLRFYNGYGWSTLATTQTDAQGNYLYTDVPSLGPGQIYYVRYVNESYDSSRLSSWWTRQITSFSAGGFANAGNFDLANIELNQPYHGMTVPLPVTFSWVKRAATPSDSYELNMFSFYDQDLYYYTPLLGYVNQYTMASLPPGFEHWTDYGWYMAVYSPDGGYGESYYYHEIRFASGSNNSVDMRDVPLGTTHQPLFHTGVERLIKP